MSTGDWFTLRPLNFNFDDINQRLTNVENRVSTLENFTNDLNTSVTSIETRLFNVEQFADTINVNLLNLTQQVNGMNQTLTNLQTTVNNMQTTVNNMQTDVNSILDLYKPISWFTYNSVRFTDISDNTTYGSFRGVWYRPIKFLDVFSNEGVDLKLLVLAIREFTINNIPSGVVYNSDPLLLPLPPVNNNDFRVFWSNTVTEHKMNTKEAEYILYYVPINTWGLSVMNRSGTGINSDSVWFFIGYF
jgi:archaellum component FlaC